MKPNSRAYNRDVSKRKALRKRRITREVYGDIAHPYYDNLHQYSKNKVHCSCPLCSAKSKNKGKRRQKTATYEPSYNWKIADLRKFNRMDISCEDAGV